MVRILLGASLAAPLALIAAPALASGWAHNPQQVAAARAAGCAVQYVHSTTSKTVYPSAIVRCDKARSVETASRDAARDRRQSGTN